MNGIQNTNLTNLIANASPFFGKYEECFSQIIQETIISWICSMGDSPFSDMVTIYSRPGLYFAHHTKW